MTLTTQTADSLFLILFTRTECVERDTGALTGAGSLNDLH